MDRNMEEKKGLLSALAEALKQYELNQSDDKESQVIALEEKLDEIAKMISSLSDRVDSLSSRLTSIGDKVDSLAAVEPKVEEDDFEAVTAEPVFDAADVDDSFHLTMDEDVFEEPAVEEEDIDEQIEAEEAQEPVEENADAVENAPEAESEPEPEEEVTEQELETEDNPVAEEEAVEEEKAEEEPVEEPEGVSTKTSRDWYDWEYDYPAEYVDSLLDSMGINDKLEFVRELFNSDPAKFDSQMREVETMPNFKAIVQFFRQAHPEWDQGSDTVYRFYMHIRRKFRN
ncbi:MAG: hypothetical protein J6T04_01720 [Bacteroidales bacterium]|nr:hypothetical protein [Bacteroidales bacterium]